jgi:hypothetical protein
MVALTSWCANPCRWMQQCSDHSDNPPLPLVCVCICVSICVHICQCECVYLYVCMYVCVWCWLFVMVVDKGTLKHEWVKNVHHLHNYWQTLCSHHHHFSSLIFLSFFLSLSLPLNLSHSLNVSVCGGDGDCVSIWTCMSECVYGVDCVWWLLIRELWRMNDSKMQTILGKSQQIFSVLPSSSLFFNLSFSFSLFLSISLILWMNQWLISWLIDWFDGLIDWVFYPREDVTRAWSQSKILQDGCIDIMMPQPLSMNAAMQ